MIPATVCKMPEPVENPKEAQLYRMIRDRIVKMHCADKRPSHRCAGTVSIDRTSIVLDCPRCGSHKALLDD